MNRADFTLRAHEWDKAKDFLSIHPQLKDCSVSIHSGSRLHEFPFAATFAENCLNHIERGIMRASNITGSTQSTVESNIQIGQLLKLMFIGLVAADGFHGRISRNPSHLQHFNLYHLRVKVDGRIYPTKPYIADFPRRQHLEFYDRLLDTLGRK